MTPGIGSTTNFTNSYQHKITYSEPHTPQPITQEHLDLIAQHPSIPNLYVMSSHIMNPPIRDYQGIARVVLMAKITLSPSHYIPAGMEMVYTTGLEAWYLRCRFSDGRWAIHHVAADRLYGNPLYKVFYLPYISSYVRDRIRMATSYNQSNPHLGITEWEE